MPGGIKNVTTIEYHVYDLDMNRTLKTDLPYVLATEKITNSRFSEEFFVAQYWKLVEIYCRDNGLDYDYHLNSVPSAPLIIESGHHLYFQFLDCALMFCDPFVLPHFLDYQLNNFKGNSEAKNREEFLAKVLFTSYEKVGLNSPNANLHRREKIFDWLESQNIKDLPLRFSQRRQEIEDNRYRGKLTKKEVVEYWMKLTEYSYKGNIVTVLTEAEVRHFLHANFWGFHPQRQVEKLTIKHISQAEFRRFCKEFFKDYRETSHTKGFIQILKHNFSIFDKTSESSLTKNFSR
jgi:hypothetical protein